MLAFLKHKDAIICAVRPYKQKQKKGLNYLAKNQNSKN